MNSKLIAFVLTLVPMLLFGNSLGITKQQLEAKYGSPSVKMSMGKIADKEMLACAFTLTGTTIFYIVDNTVVEIKHSFENTSGITEAEFWGFMKECEIGPDWAITKTDNGTPKVVETKRADGSTGVIIKRNTSIMAIFRLGSWLKINEDYNKQPWYKKIF
jgi:hypothetical protein